MHSDDEKEEQATRQPSKNTIKSRIQRALQNNDLSEAEEKALESDIERMLKMFYLEMRVKGMLTEFKNDYFV